MFKNLFGLVAALLFSVAHAQPVPATDPVPRVAFPLTQVGNVSTIGPRTADAANAAKFSFGVASNGAIFANTSDRLPTPGGASIPIGVSGTIAKPSVAAAIGRFARKGLPLVSTGFALYDLGQELGFGMDNSSGTLVVTEKPPGYCSSSPCYEYSLTFVNMTWHTTKQAACAQRVANLQVSAPSEAPWVVTNALLGNGAQCEYRNKNHSYYSGAYSQRTRTPDSSPNPSSVEAFENAIAAKSGWPTTSALARTMVDAIKAGETPLVEPQTVTGPATSPGPSSSTHNVTNNTTTLSAATHHHTYAGPNITTTTVTNTSTINNTTQEVIDEQETTQTPVIPEPQKLEFPCGAAGLPSCNVKVDETGVPAASSAGGSFDKGNTDMDKVKTDALAAINDAKEDDDLPPWSWTFQFPAGCAPYPLEVFAMSINICQFQPVIHDLMSFLWLSAGVFGLLALFRSSVGT